MSRVLSVSVLGAALAAAVGFSEEGFPLRCLGKITPRHAKQIAASNWSVGAETMDRDFTVYKHWREHLGPLGVKKARIQAGWAKTEKQAGHYDWTWLDEIIPDMVDQGVEPWVCLCYGNPIYPGGGGTGLGGDLPSTPEALAAWDRFVAAFVDRYKAHVDEWEVWNEPRTGRGQGAIRYARFVARTAETVRACQPEARVIFAAGGAFDIAFVEQVLAWLRDQNQLGLVDEVAYHPYAPNPDTSYAAVERLRQVVLSFSPKIGLRQGENGCPSQPGSFGALAKHAWTESAQAKWALRRLLGDLGRDIPSSYFSICDMHYPDRLNSKGLLATNPDKTVRHRKPAYRAVQHVTAVFDGSVERIKDFEWTISGAGAGSRFSAFAYRAPGGTIVTLWRSSDEPDKRPEIEYVALAIRRGGFREPVWVDMLSGEVYDLGDRGKRHGEGFVFERLPVYDSVVLIADRKAIGAISDRPAASPGRTPDP